MRKRVALICGLAGLPMVAGAQNVIVFADALGPGFQNWSWATVNLSTASPVHGGLLSISFEPDNFEGLYFASPGIVRSFTDFDGLRFWIHGGAGGGQNIRLSFQLGQTEVYQRALAQIVSGGAIAAGEWREVHLSFSGAGAPAGSFDGIILQDGSGGNQPAVHVVPSIR